MMKYYDVHCHLDMLNDNELNNIVADNSIVMLSSNSLDLSSTKKNVELSKKYEKIKACGGIHPEYPEKYDEAEEVLQYLKENISDIHAIGEIGLPCFHVDKEKIFDKALYVFEEFLKFSEKYSLPVTLHASYEAGPIAIGLLEKYNIKKALFHWFCGDDETLEHIIKNHYFISISPDILFNMSYENFVKRVNPENMLFESDSPWVYNGTKGMPFMIPEAIYLTSSIKSLSIDELSTSVLNNSNNFFNKTV